MSRADVPNRWSLTGSPLTTVTAFDQHREQTAIDALDIAARQPLGGRPLKVWGVRLGGPSMCGAGGVRMLSVWLACG
jgi:hypothetical protein